jgi:sulfoxide reductase heme-binding subunit YedZ
MTSVTTWYAARGAGITAYLLVTATVLLGVTLSGRRVRALPRFALEDVHRFIGLLTGVFVTIHVAGIALDTVVPFSLTQLVVPFTADYRPLWTGLGVVTLELLLALAITNRLRGRLPYRVWRGLHTGSFAVWALATVHGVLAGTDRDTVWARLLYGAAVAAVVAAVTTRLSRTRPLSSSLPIGGALGAVAAIALVLLSAVSLPAPAGTTPTTVPREEISAPFSGRLDQRDSFSARLVSVFGNAGTGRDTALRIDLLQTREGVDTALQLRFPDGAGCTGTVSVIDRSGFSGSCTTPQGTERSVEGTWSVTGEEVNGTVNITTGNAAGDGAIGA